MNETVTHNGIEYVANESTKTAPISPKIAKHGWSETVKLRELMFEIDEDAETITYHGTGPQLFMLVAYVLLDILRDAEVKHAITGFTKVRVRKSLVNPTPTEESIEEIKDRGATA